MKRMALLSTILTFAIASAVQAQVIGTYRPSVSTYYPTTASVSVSPVTHYMPVKPASYSQPVITSSTPVPGTMQVISGANVYTQPASTSYAQIASDTEVISQTQYAAQPTTVVSQPAQYAVQPTQYVYQQPAVASPMVVGNNCCQPVAAAPAVSYAAPVNCCYTQPMQVQQVAYQSAANPTCVPPDGRHYVGRTLWGSPKVYAERQPLRNALRFLGP